MDRCGGLLLEVSYGEARDLRAAACAAGRQGFFEAGTFNELETEAGIVEADKLWLRGADRKAMAPKAGTNTLPVWSDS